MDYTALYQQKLTTADEAVKVVKSGDWVDYGWCTGTPVALDKALAARMGELEDVNFRGGVLMRRPAVFDIPDAADKITWNSWHMSGIERKACMEGFGFYSALRYSEMPRWYRENVRHVNVAMIQVAPMDAHGWFSFGPQASHLKAVCDVSDVIIVEVNKYMPRCLGGFEDGIHISQVDMIVESDTEMPQMGAGGEPTEVDKAVAKLIVEEIPNGACLQLGIGGMPNTVGSMIAESDLKDLGVHTEMYVDAFVDISRAGKINGSKKAIDRGYELTLRLDEARKIEVGTPYQRAKKPAAGQVRHRPAAHPGMGELRKSKDYHIYEHAKAAAADKKLTFALAGNQNCGKTTLFNQLTGANQHVGNFPGVTVDRKDGTIRSHPEATVTDLPGIYSLSPYSSEEIVTRSFLLDNKPDGIINIVDATNIERNLYLTSSYVRRTM